MRVSQQLDLRAINFVIDELLVFCASLKEDSEQAGAIGLSPSDIESELVSFVDRSCQSALLAGAFSKQSTQPGALQFFKKFTIRRSANA